MFPWLREQHSLASFMGTLVNGIKKGRIQIMSDASSTLTVRIASAFEAARDGDHQATALILNQYKGLIRRTLHERLGDQLGKTRDIDDLEQDVAIRLMRSLSNTNGEVEKHFNSGFDS